MLSRLVVFAVKSFAGGSGKSWLITSSVLAVFSVVRRVAGRRGVVDGIRSKPGDRIVIEHLPITHREQMKEMKQIRRSERRRRKATRKDRRRAQRLADV